MTIDQYKNDELIHENHKFTNNEATSESRSFTDNPTSFLVDDNSPENSGKNIFRNDVVDLQNPAEIVITQKLLDQNQEQSSSFIKDLSPPAELTGTVTGLIGGDLMLICFSEFRKFFLHECDL